ncbi:MAG: phenylalanine--tRNA ligase subunit beta [Bacteroidales bacterium]|nr:phenylalanine--tRNA ligase subunit beta [Bacteroidales bacterium]MDY6405678.1 phenylalanine--tRNA ligase subunit beta [Bacteroidales bacterium]
MNISYKWLKRYIDLQDDAETVAKILTSIGLEVGTVETVETIKGGLKGLVVGEVLTCEPHPNSDHLHITKVNIGEGEPLPIVCGAPNVAAGQKVIVATIGTVLYDGDQSFTIKKGKLRGEDSWGMICAEDEIGVGTDHAGIIVLPADTPVGMPAAEFYHVENDAVIEVDITPNRSDACSHFGVARDLYAYYKAHGQNITLTKPSVEAFKVNNNELPIQVTVDAPEAAPRYTGVSIKGVEVKESPEWLKNSLLAIGLRPINNVVDVTNFVLHEMGQALHAFDADEIKGNAIHVRYAKAGEKFITLDGVEREMNERDLMIANTEEAMCIAGVFGGLKSGVTEKTKNVFLESAYFDPVTIRKTSRRHQLQTDASFRYERGCDPNNTLYVLQRAALLIQELAGGEIAMNIVDTVNGDFKPWDVTIDINRVNSLIGKAIGEDTIETILRALEINIVAKLGDSWQLEVPRYRVDVQRECDVVEDILRIYGYDNVEFPEKLNTSLAYGVKPDPEKLRRRIAEQLTAQGFNEILNNSLTKVSYYEPLQSLTLDTCVKIMNPLSQDLGVMRQTLLFGGLESIARNANRKNADLKFYEFGNCYHYNGELKIKNYELIQNDPLKAYSEEPHLALWLTGNKAAQTWVRKEEKTTFYLLRAYVNNILVRLGVDLSKTTVERLENELFSDGLVLKAANGKVLGFIGIVARKQLKAFDIDQEVFYADLDWNQLLKQNKQYKAVINDLPKYPEVKRDFALLVDKTVEFADLARAAFATEKKLLKNVYLFDVYEGKNLEAGKKSYALSFILQDAENTLKDTQIENIMNRMKATFEEKFHATLR